jgi:hypothetical protein
MIENRNSVEPQEKMKSKTYGVLFAALPLTVALCLRQPQVHADEANSVADTAALQLQIDKLQRQVDELSATLKSLQENQKKVADANGRAGATPAVTAKTPLLITGLVQLQGLARLSESGPAANSASTFRLRRGQLGFQAQITPKISAVANIDFAKAQDNTDRPADSVLQDLYISYLLNQSKDKKNVNYVDVGQQKVPFGYESLVPSGALPLIETALMYQLRDPIRGNYGGGRDTGIQLRGSQGKLEYRFGVYNGFGERQNALAISDAKAILGRLGYNLAPTWQIGISAARGNTGVTSSVRADRNLWNAYTYYKKGKLSLQGEYIEGNYADAINGTQDIQSYYGHSGYFLTSKLEGVVRVDYFNYRNLHAAIKEYTLGLNYYLKGNNAKIQLNVIKRDGDKDAPGTVLDNDATELRTNFQIAF